MDTNWRISTFNGALLASYFIPTWTIVAFRIIISPIHGLYEQPNISLVLFIRVSIRKTGGCDEALAMALGIGSLISFASMIMASQVGETGALRLHATELLLLLGTAIVMVVEPPVQRGTEQVRTWPPEPQIYPFGSSPSS